MEMRNLQKLIEDKKVELIKLVNKYGFRHQQVLSLSQDIDKLIKFFIILLGMDIKVFISKYINIFLFFYRFST
ncbi:hypothetical protein J3D61_005772 [Bacillus cereus]|nr:hypothetical protein [Bacillus cereus]